MLLLQKLKRLIYHSDMFCSSEMLRYNAETQYKTLTGGLFSISIIIFIVIGFASMISDTLNRTTISASLQTIKQGDPPLSVLKTNSEGMFMFGLAIQSFDISFNADLATGPRYFDILLAIAETTNGTLTGFNPIPMEQCTAQHWSMLPDISNRFHALGASKWVCPPKDIELKMQGIYNSPINSQVFISIGPCINNTFSTRNCAPQDQIDALMSTYQNFFLTINYINPVISPTEQNHISYYSEVNDYIIFSKTIGSQAWIYFSDYTINTDNSIWPFQDTIVERGSIVEQRAINHAFSVTPLTAYATIYLARSVNSLIYTRIVQKVSAVLSYIGGLVGAMTAVLFLIKTYTDCSLQITIGINLFDDFQREQTHKKAQEKPTFNFFKFLGLELYQLMRSLGVRKKWSGMNKLYNFQKQIVKQLDIRTLLKRIIYLEQSMTYLFNDIELQGLKYQKPISCERVKKNREMLLHEIEEDQIEEQSNITDSVADGTFDKNAKIELTENNLNIHQLTIKQTYPITPNKEQITNHIEKFNIQIISMNGHENYDNSDLSEQIPVQFIDKNPIKIFDRRQSCEKMIGRQLLDEKCIQNLKVLHKMSKQNMKSSKIWMNLREQVQKIIQYEMEYHQNQQQIYS